VYGVSDLAVRRLAGVLVRRACHLGMREPHRIPLRKVPKGDIREPFGFVDGISQPVIRGTYKGLRNADPIHLVEPGEFILGYPDNRGNAPPGPTLPADADPTNLLPVLNPGTDFGRTVVGNTRDVGFNGSFLVIRELEQDVEGFWAYCKREAERLDRADRLPAPYVVNEEFIAAKLVGRWQDGSSLVRHAYEPKPREKARYDAGGRPRGGGREGEERRDEAHETARPTTRPADAPPVERPRSRALAPTTTSCSAPKTRKRCGARSARTSAVPIRVTARTPVRPTRSRSAIVTASSGSDASTNRRRGRNPACSSCA
jgi:hypothetical protein